MIVALAATLAVATPSREGLIERWFQANPAHSIARLDSGPRNAVAAPPDLATLAQRELATPGRYHLTQPIAAPVSEPLWLRVWRWIANRWQQLWHAIFGRVRVGKAQAASIGDVLLFAVGALLIYVVIRLVREVQFARSGAGEVAEPLAEAPSPRGLYKRACAAAAAGDYGSAALLLFAATVALLDRRGAVDLTSSATVGDLRRALRSRERALVPAFDAVAAPFVQRAYGDRTLDESQWTAARAAYDTLCHPEPVEGRQRA